MFSLEREVSSFRFATPLREFSRVLVRFCSISEALVPGYEDITIITLASNSGSWAMGILVSEKRPNTRKAIKMRAVVTGCRTAVL